MLLLQYMVSITLNFQQLLHLLVQPWNLSKAACISLDHDGIDRVKSELEQDSTSWWPKNMFYDTAIHCTMHLRTSQEKVQFATSLCKLHRSMIGLKEFEMTMLTQLWPVCMYHYKLDNNLMLKSFSNIPQSSLIDFVYSSKDEWWKLAQAVQNPYLNQA